MLRHLLRSGAFLLAWGVLGCGSTPPVVVDDGEDDTRLAGQIDVSVADWLGKPREELAKMVKDRLETVRLEQDFARSNPASVDLLPDLKPFISLPVFQEAAYSKKAGVSLPPYLAPGARDREVALHLARNGDGEAAALFADPADADLKARLDGLRCGRNYPLEWTQLVALNQVSAEFKLATGNLEAASTLVHLHRQLGATLDKKAAAGPLGAALLARGHRALSECVPALRDSKVNKKRLANDVEAALRDWGEAPTPAPAVELGAPRAEVARIFHSQEKGRVLTAVTREDCQRVTDLLALPLTHELVEGVVAFLDDKDRLSELFVHYFNTVAQQHPEPLTLAGPLVDGGVGGGPVDKQKGILRQTFVAGKWSYQVNIIQAATAGSTPAGAIVRVGDAAGTFAAASLPANPRELGVVHLDKSFDQNRLALDPGVKPEAVLEFTRPQAVARVQQPVVNPRPGSVVLTREADVNLLASVAVRWPSDENKHALARLLVPLWAAYGGARMEGVDDDSGGHLAFTWEDGQTRYTMRLPYVDVRPPELVVTDRRGSESLNARLNLTATFDGDQRRARFAADKPLERLPRWLYLNQVRLGMTRAEAVAALPKRDTLHTTEIPDGLNVHVVIDAPKDVTHWARQMFVRFTPGKEGRVAEIRVRYQEGPAAPSPQAPALFDLLRKAPNGEPETLAPTWAGLWTDLPAKKFKAVRYRWLDDRTVMTYERDAAGSEVTVRDCPLEHPLGQPLPPLAFCSRGLPGVTLGDDRADVLKRWKVEKPQANADGSLELGAGPADGPYDAVAVWFDKDKVSRVVARHRANGALQKGEVAAALQEYWSDNVDQLGVIRRVDTLGAESAVSQRLPSWGWHDDRTRVRCFGTDTEGGARLFTEWREWPVAGKPS
jgi:hypothetical protein